MTGGVNYNARGAGCIISEEAENEKRNAYVLHCAPWGRVICLARRWATPVVSSPGNELIFVAAGVD